MEATTTGSGQSVVALGREDYEAPLVLRGQIQRGHSGLWRSAPVSDPAHFAATAFEEVLVQRGIELRGGVRSHHDAATSPIGGRQFFAPAMDGGPVVQALAVHRSPPLLDILKVVNQRSHNLYAESVLRVVGRVVTGSGSVDGGAEAVAAMLEAEGATAAVAGLVMDDGSGLSRLDGASPSAIVELLALMTRSPHWEAFWETLPEAATTQGLRRMHQTAAAGNLRAKTGTINGVSALSGYVQARNGERLAFSIIANDVPSGWGAKRVEDRIGARLANFNRPAYPPPPGSVRVADAAAAAQPRGARSSDGATSSGPPQVDDENTQYTVRRGDTLEAIARRHGIPVPALREANPGVQDRRLMPGHSLRIPAGAASSG
jgi:D-alanyl-D-alanine carboxypeptidase